MPPKPSKWWQIDLLCSSRLRDALFCILLGAAKSHATGINACDRWEQSSQCSNTMRSIDCVTAPFSGRCQSCQSYELISGGSHPSEWLIQHRYDVSESIRSIPWAEVDESFELNLCLFPFSRKVLLVSLLLTSLSIYITYLIFTDCLRLALNYISDLLTS